MLSPSLSLSTLPKKPSFSSTTTHFHRSRQQRGIVRHLWWVGDVVDLFLRGGSARSKVAIGFSAAAAASTAAAAATGALASSSAASSLRGAASRSSAKTASTATALGRGRDWTWTGQ